MLDKRVEAIWEELGVSLRGFILKRVGDEQVADDILQDVFIKIHTHLASPQIFQHAALLDDVPSCDLSKLIHESQNSSRYSILIH